MNQTTQPLSAVSARKIDPDVLKVLSGCDVEGHLVRLPPGQLERKLYQQVDEVLRALGGKWIGRKVLAHQFDEDPSAIFEVVVATGTFVKPQDFGYFPTPPDLVKRVLDMADIQPGMRVLEPSAGSGSFASPLAALVGAHNLVTVYELLPRNAQRLRDAGFRDAAVSDFLLVNPDPVYDRVVMNPPFGGGVDMDHVMHAAKFLKPDGKLIAITSPSWTFNSSRKAESFREFVNESAGLVEEVEAGAFKSVGTAVATRIESIDAENLPWNLVQIERQQRDIGSRGIS